MPHRRRTKGEVEEQRELIAEITTFISDSEGADSRERSLYVEDLDFVYSEGGQWDEKTVRMRGTRPTYTFNRVLGAVNQTIGEQRLNKTSIKIRPVDDGADPDTAEVFSGMIRNIEGVSNAEDTYDMAFKNAVAGGYGGWRVVSEHFDNTSFNQEIRIKSIHNIMTVFWDPLSFDPVKRDQTKCVVAERISKEFYIEKYGGQPNDIRISRDSRGWVDEKGVRIAEYFKLIPKKKTIAELADGRVVDFDDDLKKIENELKGTEGEVKRKRVVDTLQVHWWKVDGARVLEGPIVYDWRFIPVVKLPGRYINIEGRQKTQSLIRHSKDAQRAYNYSRTTQTEVVANTPRQPYLVTAAMIKGYEKQWAGSGSKNSPYLTFNPDIKAPTISPQRAAAAEVPSGLIALSAQDADDIKATTGFFDASLGKQGNEISGTAIKGRARQADIGSYEFFDNYKKAVQFTGDILVDMIPKVYDTKRIVRIIGLDGQEDFATINAFDQNTNKKIDLSAGLYDVTVDIGPAFASQREETLNTLLQAAEIMPIIGEVAPDLIAGNIDSDVSDELVKRLRKPLVASGAIDPNKEEQEEIDKQPEPPPNRVEEALVGESESKTDLNKARTVETLADAKQTEVETQEKLNQMPVKQKQLQADLVGGIVDKVRNSKE